MKHLILTAFLFILFQFKALAHPHVFIETNVTVGFGENKIDYLLVSFDFDKMFSLDLIKNFDKNNNKKFDPAEVDEIESKAFANLVNYNYFIHIRDNGKVIKITEVSEFDAEITADGKVQYFFSVDTDIVITSAKTVKIAAYDHSYYIDVRFRQPNVRFINEDKAKFTWKMIEDKSLAYFYNQLNPPCAVMSFTKN